MLSPIDLVALVSILLFALTVLAIVRSPAVKQRDNHGYIDDSNHGYIDNSTKVELQVRLPGGGP